MQIGIIERNRDVGKLSMSNPHPSGYPQTIVGNTQHSGMTLVIENDYCKSSTGAIVKNTAFKENKPVIRLSMVAMPYDDLYDTLAEELNSRQVKSLHITGPNLHDLRKALSIQQDSDDYVRELLTGLLKSKILLKRPDWLCNGGNSGIEQSVITVGQSLGFNCSITTNRAWMYKDYDGFDVKGYEEFSKRFNPF